MASSISIGIAIEAKFIHGVKTSIVIPALELAGTPPTFLINLDFVTYSDVINIKSFLSNNYDMNDIL